MGWRTMRDINVELGRLYPALYKKPFDFSDVGFMGIVGNVVRSWILDATIDNFTEVGSPASDGSTIEIDTIATEFKADCNGGVGDLHSWQDIESNFKNSIIDNTAFV